MNDLKRYLLSAAVVWMSTVACGQDDWPQWRGSHWDSVSRSELAADMGPDQKPLWRVEMPGPAGSSPIVMGDRVFVTSSSGDQLVLLAVSTDGTALWECELGGQDRHIRMDNANLASPSPVTDGRHVWATSGAGVLNCFTLEGELVWRNDLQQTYGRFDIQFGMSSTPILDQGRLYLQLLHGSMSDPAPGIAWLICLEAESGKELWKQHRTSDASAENKHAYTSPTIYRDESREFLLIHGGDYLTGHALDDGRELWRCGGFNPKNNYNATLRLVASPTCVPGMIVAPSAKRGPVFCLKPDKLVGDVSNQSDAFHWKLDRGTPDVASPVIHQGLVYLATESGTMTCVDAATGDVVYQERWFADRHRSTPVAIGARLYLTTRDGKLLVIQAGTEPKKVLEIDLGEETTASPAVAHGRIYLRTFEALYAFGSAATAHELQSEVSPVR